jgi:hypothetical protein
MLPEGIPFGNIPPMLGTLGTAGKVWAKDESQNPDARERKQKREKDLRDMERTKIYSKY